MTKNKLVPAQAGNQPTITTREQADAALAQMALFAATIAEHAKAEAEEKAQREAVESTYTKLEKAVIAWAKKDRKTWEGKSLALAHGTVSFQVSPGKVGVIKGVVKSLKDAVILLSKSRRAWAAQFLRVKPPVLNGEVLVQEFTDGRITNEQLAEVGLKVDKPEICRVEINQA